MNEIDGLKFNLIRKYRTYNLPTQLFDDSIEYAQNNSKKGKTPLITLASQFIELNILTDANKNSDYRKIIEQIYQTEASIFSTRNRVPISKIEAERDKIIDKIVSKNNHKTDVSISTVIRNQMDKSLLKYKIDKKDNRILREVPKNDEITFDENMQFLRKYYNLTELSNITGISIYELSNCFINRRPMSNKIKEKILTSFSVSDPKELFEKLSAGTIKKKKKTIIKKEIHEEIKPVATSKKEKKSERKVTNSRVTSSKTYSITFLKDYFEVNKLSKSAFARHMSVSLDTVNNWFEGKLLKENYLQSLLDYFQIDSLPNLISKVRRELNDVLIAELNGEEVKKVEIEKELQSEVKPTIELKSDKPISKKVKSNKYDISFFHEYIKKKHMSTKTLCNILNLSLTSVNRFLSKERLLREEKLELLLKYFKVSNYDELKNKILEESKKDKMHGYDISFFNKYIEAKNMTKTKLCDILHLSFPIIDRILKSKRLLKEEELQLLLEYFKVSNYDELKNKILEESKNEKIKETPKNRKIKKYDITFMNKYIENKNMTKTKLAKILNLSCATVIKVLKGERLLKEEELELLLKHFNKESYLELKEFFIKMTDEELKKSKVKSKRETNKIYDISFFYNYIKSKNITKNELLLILNVSDATLYKMIKGDRLLSKSELELLLKYFNKGSYLELKEFIREKNGWTKVSTNEYEKTYSLKFFDMYLSNNGILLKQFSDTMNIRQEDLFNYIKKGKFASEKTLKLFLDKFEVSTYEELKEKVSSMITTSTKKLTLHLDDRVSKSTTTRLNNEYYNISFLKSYVKDKKIKLVDLANYLKISSSALSNYLNGKSEINVEHINKLCKYFKVETIDELEEIVKIANSKYKINKYIKYILSRVSVDELSEKLNIPVSTVKNMLAGYTNVKKEQFDKILEILNIKDLEELQTKTDEHNEKQNNIGDLSCVREYLKLKNIYLSSLATDMGITHQRLGQYLSNSGMMPYNLYQKMLDTLEFDSLDELREYLKKDDEKIENYYEAQDLQIIRKYMKLKNITFTDLSVRMGVSYATISNYINNKKKMTYHKFKKMLECLGFENVNQIKQIIKQYESEIHVELDNIDMTYVKEYMRKVGISQAKLAEDLKIGTATAYKWLNNQNKIKTEDFIRVLEYLGFENLKQIKEKLEELRNNNIGKSNPENSIYIEYIKTYMKNNDINCEMIAERLGKETQKIRRWLKYNIRISKEDFEALIKCLGFNTIDELILSLNEMNTIDEDIETIKKYVLINKISHANIAHKINYAPSTITCWLNDKPKMNSAKIKIVLNALGFDSIIELKEELTHTKEKEEIKDLTPLKKYLKDNNIMQKEIAELIGMNDANFGTYLSNKRTLPTDKLKKILNYLGFNSYDELLEKISEESKEKNEELAKKQKEEVLKDKRFECALKIVDTEFDLINDTGDVTKTKISQSFTSSNCSIDNLERVLNSLGFEKVDEFSKDTKEETLEKLNLNSRVNNQYLVYNYVDNYNKKSIITQKWENKNPKISIDELTDIIKCINFNLVNSDKKINDLKIDYNLEKTEARKIINTEVLFELLKSEEVTEDEYKAIILLFGVKDGKYYSIVEVSNIVSINKSEVLNIYKKCLEIYRKSFEKDYSEIAKYIYNVE